MFRNLNNTSSSTAPPPSPPVSSNAPRRKSRKSRYKSARSVVSTAPHVASLGPWTRTKVCLVCGGAIFMAIFTLSPIFMLKRLSSSTTNTRTTQTSSRSNMVGLESLLRKSQQVRASLANTTVSLHQIEEKVEDLWHSMLRQPPIPEHQHEDLVVEHVWGVGVDAGERDAPKQKKKRKQKQEQKSSEKEKDSATLKVAVVDPPTSRTHATLSVGVVRGSCNETDNRGYSVCARGVSGLPLNQTAALLGARKGHLSDCSTTGMSSTVMDDLVYWNDPQGTRDVEFTSPFVGSSSRHASLTRFLVFEPDPGGWNNVRMSMEILFVLASVTGRILVLPPKLPLYLLGQGEAGAKSFGNFYNLTKLHHDERVSMMSMTEFVQGHGQELLGLSPEEVTALMPLADMCVYRENDPRHCDILYKHFRDKGMQPQLEASTYCLVFDEDVFRSGETDQLAPDLKQRVERFCGDKRTAVYYTDELHQPPLLHWQASSLDYRLLNHFYAFLYFTDPVVDNHYKRFVRDYLHYTNEIYCAAAKIVEALGTNFSSLHIRRGDFQFKEVKLSADEWYNNTKELWEPGEVLYIATDERNRTWFEPIARHHPVKFLDDYRTMAGLDKMDSSFLGMVDSIVASEGRVFAGTWFSTFTGYINRLRGYSGKSMTDSWYSFLPRKTAVHEWAFPQGNYHAREWPIGWVGIDGDEILEQEGAVTADADPAGKKIAHSELKQDTEFISKPMARGVAGRPKKETPALDGGSRAHIQCDVNVDSMAYWNDPQGLRDYQFKSPFAVEGDTKYISFTADRGGWNNIRMSMEIIFVIAAASGRTLVLPPEQSLYLLHHDKGKRDRGFADFFPLYTSEFQSRVPVISFEEFVKREGGPGGRLMIPEDSRKAVLLAAAHCDHRAKSSMSCTPVEDYLAGVGHSPTFRAKDGCVVFDANVYNGGEIDPAYDETVRVACGNRTIAYWDEKIQQHDLLHFRAGEKAYRLLTHYYNMLVFTDPAIDHYFKRFVRDFLHYHDTIYCAAGKIVKALQSEGQSLGFQVDDEGAGGFSAMHIRRGDFQYKKVKIPAEEWYNNTQEIWQPSEILYIATDERNKTWFDPIAAHHTLRFLDDYCDVAGLGDVDPNYMGMIDTIVASRARAFAGTWFSTFSGYINRMRGHHGMSMQDSWYSFMDRKTALHEWKPVSHFVYAYEWPSGWVGIDADVWPSKDKF